VPHCHSLAAGRAFNALAITGVLPGPKDASGLTIITCEDDTDAPALIS
jgi:hypothetical protein